MTTIVLLLIAIAICVVLLVEECKKDTPKNDPPKQRPPYVSPLPRKEVEKKPIEFKPDRMNSPSIYMADGFLNPTLYPIGLTDHARDRMIERMGKRWEFERLDQAKTAYRFGKSARQLPKSSAWILHKKEENHENTVALLFGGYIYIFSRENILITVYENDAYKSRNRF